MLRFWTGNFDWSKSTTGSRSLSRTNSNYRTISSLSTTRTMKKRMDCCILRKTTSCNTKRVLHRVRKCLRSSRGRRRTCPYTEDRLRSRCPGGYLRVRFGGHALRVSGGIWAQLCQALRRPREGSNHLLLSPGAQFFRLPPRLQNPHICGAIREKVISTRVGVRWHLLREEWVRSAINDNQHYFASRSRYLGHIRPRKEGN